MEQACYPSACIKLVTYCPSRLRDIRMLIQGDTRHVMEKRHSRPCLLGSGVVGGRRIFSFPCLFSVHLADVVTSHDSAAPVGRTSCSKYGARIEHWEERRTRAGWTQIQFLWKKQEDAPQLIRVT